MNLLISASELNSALSAEAAPRILDIRWDLGKPDGRPDYLEAHIPGAVYVDLTTELATVGDPGDGVAPMPSVATLQAAARRWGLNRGDRVVVYDNASGIVAGRALWLLRHAGVDGVRLLDGGLADWQAQGFAVESGDVEPVPGSIELAYGGIEILTRDDVGAFAQNGLLLDARAPQKYTGEDEPLEPRAGHIPGAVSAPAGANLGAEGRYRSLEDLAKHYEGLGVTKGRPVGVYCGGGISCSADFIVLSELGYDVAVYPGSWSEYSAHPELPVATGAEPGGA